jgi:hypothetical protein
VIFALLGTMPSCFGKLGGFSLLGTMPSYFGTLGGFSLSGTKTPRKIFLEE